MLASERAFFSDLIDYAGLFPPAQLPLETALGNYLRYRGEPEAWLLARFICPAGRLHELRAPALRLSILGRGGDVPGIFLDNLRTDLMAVAQFRDALGPAAGLECFETRLLAGGLEDPERLLTTAAGTFAAQGFGALPRFYELPASADWHPIAGVLAASDGVAGLKLRCGGLGPAAIPSVAQVAAAIGICLANNVPLKFTAGLHQPMRRSDPALGVQVHGFLNLFAAGILGASRGLAHDELMAVVAEEDARRFAFTEDSFAWRDVKVTASEIAQARRRRVISFGSCSFDEPRDGLRELGHI